MNAALLDNPVLPSRSRAYASRMDMRSLWRDSALQVIERSDHPERPSARAYVSGVDRPRPQDYAAYHELLVATSGAGDTEREAVATSLLARAPRPTSGLYAAVGPRLTNFSGGFYPEEALGIMSRWLGFGPGQSVSLGSLPGPMYTTHSALVRRALRCLNHFVPEFHDELTQVVSELVLCTFEFQASGPRGSEAVSSVAVRSACSFAVWGAVFLDPRQHADELDYLATIVEEGARLALFAATHREPLVESSAHTPVGGVPADRLAQLASLDAQVHAAYAAARLALVLQRLQVRAWPAAAAITQRSASVQRGVTTMPWSSDRLHAAHAQAIDRFWSIHGLVHGNQRLSASGAELLHHACAFMAHTFGWPESGASVESDVD